MHGRVNCLLVPAGTTRCKRFSPFGPTPTRNKLRPSAGMPAGAVRDQTIASVAQEWADNDARAALAWAKALPDGEGNVKLCIASSRVGPRMNRREQGSMRPISLTVMPKTKRSPRLRDNSLVAMCGVRSAGSKRSPKEPPATKRWNRSSRSGVRAIPRRPRSSRFKTAPGTPGKACSRRFRISGRSRIRPLLSPGRINYPIPPRGTLFFRASSPRLPNRIRAARQKSLPAFRVMPNSKPSAPSFRNGLAAIRRQPARGRRPFRKAKHVHKRLRTSQISGRKPMPRRPRAGSPNYQKVRRVMRP